MNNNSIKIKDLKKSKEEFFKLNINSKNNISFLTSTNAVVLSAQLSRFKADESNTHGFDSFNPSVILSKLPETKKSSPCKSLLAVG